MSRRPLAERDPDLRGRSVLVVGLGVSGLAAARLACAKGARVTVNDSKPEPALGAAAREARALGAEVVAGGHPSELALRADLIVLSPGVRPDLDLLREARQAAVPIWGEVELGARFCRGRVVAITGSNGKSTVTSMIGTILRGAGVAGGTGGNLATPFCEMLQQQDGADAIHALELSSFQLETLSSLRPDVAAVLNLSPDHLDRYGSFEEYARAKQRLLALQQAGAHTILNADDAPSRRLDPHVRGRLALFSTHSEPRRGAYLEHGSLVLRTELGEEKLLRADELTVPGEHNVGNALAAALAARLSGCPLQAIAAGLRSYRALPHRLERVGSLAGVDFFNDSKATNPASAARALLSFAPGTVHLILGGRDKGADWDELLALLPRHARRVLLVGEHAGALKRRLNGASGALECGTVSQAVAEAYRGARPGEVVLLAPGCASFDQYRNFEERGEDFRRAFRSLAGAEAGHA